MTTQVESGKARLQALESKIDGVREEAEQVDAELNSLKPELEEYKSQVRAGISVDEQAYQAAVDQFNSRLRRYKTLAKEEGRLVKEHNDLLDHVKGLIDKYNAMP